MIFNVNTSGESLKLPVLDTSYPSDVSATYTANESGSATFKAVIATDGVPASYKYQWYVDDVPVDGATESSYTKTGINSAGTHIVYCKVTNKAGSVNTRVATLTTALGQWLPTLDAAYPADVNLKHTAGNSVSNTFKVAIETAGEPANYTYQWYVNGSAVSGATNSTYTRNFSSAGTYTVYCEVTNDVGTVTSRTATATVSATNAIIYNSGDECTSVTGGWTSGIVSGQAVKLSQHLQLTSLSANTLGGWFRTTNKIDLTGYKTLSVDHQFSTGGHTLVLAADANAEVTSYDSLDAKATSEISIDGTTTLDISALNGSYYIYLISGSYGSGTRTVVVSKAELKV